MSAFELIQKSLKEIQDYLTPYAISLKETKFPDTYIVKFSHETKINDPMINQLRGLLFNLRTKKIYSMTYPVPIEVNDLPTAEQSGIVEHLGKTKYTVQEIIDGTLLRLSYIDEVDKWLLSTNGKEDANDAYWMNGSSFSEQFWSVNPSINLTTLNHNYVYMFALCHPHNVIVINHPQSQIYHVTTYDRTTFKEVECDLVLPHPPVFELDVSKIQKKNHESLEKPVRMAGYMVVTTDEQGVVHRYRFENDNYRHARQLRGDSNNLMYVMLGFMLDPNPQHLDEFLQYYPIYMNLVVQLQRRLVSLVSKLYREYGLRYKEHDDIFVHPRHHRFLSEIHTQVYLSKLKSVGKTVQYQDILNHIKSLPTAKVLYILNYIYEPIHREKRSHVHRDDQHRDDQHRDDQHRDDQHRDDQHRDDQHRDDQHRDDQHRDDQHQS
jgi:hypothetical protein